MGWRRRRIKRALRRAPEPEKGIQAKVAAYVDGLAKSARPRIKGVGSGQALQVTWPHENGGPAIDPINGKPVRQGIDTLGLLALLAGETLIDALLRQIEEDADLPMPRAQRPKRMAVLDCEENDREDCSTQYVLVLRNNDPARRIPK